ncbi:hypothetical protein P1J78_22385 [Psychromarinibacter sp. C21-152]|uniref:Uncharacterized protein n=1 Tax=Psychromarinibacter sediminicola TaxID=3033385 RepID=A0AAE3NSK6_9RHOB|nr:hypothetical protein [Psychromarinibacter sediminicola]MDF0603483.1 hypothetical protein [Psychromarinibacter sediminicola]
MLAALSDLFAPLPRAGTTAAPRPPRRTAPLLMGDILAARGGEPEFLIQWRAARDAADKGP